MKIAIFARHYRKLARLLPVLLLGAAAVGAIYLVRPEWFVRPGTPATTVLVAGLDRDGRTDTLLVVYFHARNRSVRAISLPRDTDADGSGHKINALLRRRGLPRLKWAVEALLGHPIDHTLLIRVDRLPAAINAAFPEGVPMDVPYRMHYRDHAQELAYDIPSGHQRLHGHDFVCFLRDRSDKCGDLGRMSRQAGAIRAAGQQMSAPGTWPRLPGIVGAVRNALTTDLSNGDLLALATVYRRAGGLVVSRLPGAAATRGRVSFYLPDRLASRRCAAFARRGLHVPAGLKVVVLNASGQPGLARRAAAILENAGIDVTLVATAAQFDRPATVIRYWPPEMEEYGRHAAAALAPTTPEVREDAPAGGAPRLIVEVGADANRAAPISGVKPRR